MKILALISLCLIKAYSNPIFIKYHHRKDAKNIQKAFELNSIPLSLLTFTKTSSCFPYTEKGLLHICLNKKSKLKSFEYKNKAAEKVI
jgi:hypothetical protein